MNWQRLGAGYVSDDRQYAIRGTYTAGAFAWRGRHVASDRLVHSSADRQYVQLCCERHAASAIAEAP